MGHYTLHALICLCGYYICARVTFALDDTAKEFVIPQLVSTSGSFLSHYIPRHWSRSATEDELVHYLVHIDGEPHHLELEPNRRLVAPNARMEIHSEDGIHFQKLRDVQCHFVGKVRGMSSSRVALTTCRGLSGYIRTARGHFEIEPREAQTDDRHPHLVYQRHADDLAKDSYCETRGTGSFPHKISKREEEMKETKKVASDIHNMYTTEVKRDLYLELLLVLDKAFTDHHAEVDIEHYIMTVMNMAHDLFAQESLGRPVYLSIVRIIRLEAEDNEINLSLTKDPARTLVNFLEWQDMMNPGNDSHPTHHDLAVLITRVDIYAANRNRDFLGMAHLGSACNKRLQGVLCQDVGLSLGYIISHEIGHALGFLHDAINVNGCKGFAEDGMATIMSPNINGSMADWSVCSRKMLRIFVESGFGRCLTDRPGEHPFEYTDQLPGEIYDGNWQCRNWFGNQAEMCNTAPRCDTILCLIPDFGCVDIHYPPADGTACGDDRWCYHGQCLESGMRLNARDGGWGPWSDWSHCSRTCGTGVAYSERRCDSPQPAHGGEFCRGPKTRYKICNAEPCPVGSRKFRDTQCAKFNKWIYPEDKKVHKWIAVQTYTDDPCALYCVNEAGTIAQLADIVLDGTSCNHGIRDVCIAGKCVRVSCDLEMDSGAVEDVCGICHGDGTTCTLKEGSKFFRQSPVNPETNKTIEEIFKLIDVPVGTQNIQVEEVEPANSRIEVRDGEGSTVFVEGDSFGLFEVPGSKAWLGMVRYNQEMLHIPGPIAEPISIWVQPNENVTFKYFLAVETEKRQGAFEWDFIDWTPCSVPCGTGISISLAKCIELSSGLVDETYCEGEKPKERIKTCENVPCKPSWLMGDWSKCSNKVKGETAQHRKVRCVRPSGGEVSDLTIVPASLCPQPRPTNTKQCELPTKLTCHHRGKRKVFHRPSRLSNLPKSSTTIQNTEPSFTIPISEQKSSSNHDMTTDSLFSNYLRQQQHERRQRFDTEDYEQFLEDEEDWLKRLAVERGHLQVDKMPHLLQKLTIKNEGQQFDISVKHVTSKSYVGKDFYRVMEILRRKFNKDDKV